MAKITSSSTRSSRTSEQDALQEFREREEIAISAAELSDV